jgi:hypothetical protein
MKSNENYKTNQGDQIGFIFAYLANCLLWGSIMKITKLPHKLLDYFFQRKSCVLIFTNNRLAYILGHFLTRVDTLNFPSVTKPIKPKNSRVEIKLFLMPWWRGRVVNSSVRRAEDRGFESPHRVLFVTMYVLLHFKYVDKYLKKYCYTDT